MKELGYTGYERLRRGFDTAFGGPGFVPTFSLVIDAGCGTGLVGEQVRGIVDYWMSKFALIAPFRTDDFNVSQFRNISKTLIGVDLSAAILKEAEKKRPNLYDELLVGDVMEVFRAKKPVSMIVAADSYIYFGDLVPLFESMGESLAPGGYIAFTLENVGKETEDL